MSEAGPVTITRPGRKPRTVPAYTREQMHAIISEGRSTARRCQGVTADGHRCRRYATYNGVHCQTHGAR